MKYVLIGIALFTLPLLGLYQAIVGNFIVSIPMTVIMVVAGFLFCSVSAYMAGLVGSSNNPVSGITISTILFASLVLMLLMGRNAPLGPVAARKKLCLGGHRRVDLAGAFLSCGFVWSTSDHK
jgi:uncharacterized oligopeptide transporter (OPT) family protein